MPNNFTYTFPAVRGCQAKKEYYVAMCPLKLVPRLFIFDEESVPAEYRAQRLINRARIPALTRYITENLGDYVFSSLTASIDGELSFEAISAGEPNIGKLIVSMDASFIINDGQHRRAAIEEALRLNPELGNETISVVFYQDQGLVKSQQMFADLNQHAVNTTRSIGILYDSRNDLALLTKEIIVNNPLLNRFTDKEKPSLSKFSNKIFTLSNIYSTNQQLILHSGIPEGKNKKMLTDFWAILCDNISEWKQVRDKTMNASELRSHYVHSHGVVIEAIGMVAAFLWKNEYSNWADYIRELDHVDWSRSNTTDWEGRVFDTNGKISKSKSNVNMTCARIKQLLKI